MSHKNKTGHYRIYLLTVWSEQNEGVETPAVWRFSLEDPRSGRRRGFANLAALVTALHQEIARVGEPAQTPDAIDEKGLTPE